MYTQAIRAVVLLSHAAAAWMIPLVAFALPPGDSAL